MKKIKLFRNLSLIIGCIFFFTTCKKETSLTQNTTKFGTLFGSGGNYVLKGTLKLPDNTYLLYGYTNQTTNGNYDGFVLKVDDNFNTLWYKNLGGKYDDYINSAAIDDEGNIMAVGISYSFGVAVDSGYKNNNSLFYLAYLNNNGTLINEKTLQSTISIINRYNEANKVLFLPNKTFAIAGTTSNYLTLIDGQNWYTSDAYVFGINKKMEKLWAGRYFANPPISNDYYEAEEYCHDASLTADGNIMLHVVTLANTPFLNTIKLPFTGPASSSNSYIQKSNSFINIVSNLTGYGTIMAGTTDNKMALYDITRGGIVITNNDGSDYNIIKFKTTIGITSITNTGSQLIIAGQHQDYGKPGLYPCFAITDLDGKIEQEHFVVLPPDVAKRVTLKNIFLKNNSEILAFGTYKSDIGNNLIMLRLDREGNIIN